MKKIRITHKVGAALLKDTAIRIDPAFFEILTGKRKGSLVHVWDIRKYENFGKKTT